MSNTNNDNVVTVTLNNLLDVDRSNKDAHSRLEKLLSSFEGKSLFTDGTVVIYNDKTIIVGATIKEFVDKEEASKVLRKTFF